MIQGESVGRNLWSLTVLCLLRVEPMHPYQLQRRIREWHKDEYLDLKRGSLYHAINRLHRDGLIEPVETSREGRRPERTTYRLTAQGEAECLAWLRQLLARPAKEPSQFFAALSFLPNLTPEDVREQLQERVRHLETQIVFLNGVLTEMIPRIGRLVLVEVEYSLAMLRAEMAWVRTLDDELREGRLDWNPCQLLELGRVGEAEPTIPPE